MILKTLNINQKFMQTNMNASLIEPFHLIRKSNNDFPILNFL
jgi:hypothetical protein